MEEHAGKWVALVEGEIIFVTDEMEEALLYADEDGRANVAVTKVGPDGSIDLSKQGIDQQAIDAELNLGEYRPE